MRLTGAALLVGAGVMAGLTWTGELRGRVRLREELCRMLALLGFELERFRTPLPALFQRLSGQLTGPAEALCRRLAGDMAAVGERPLAEIWAEAISPLPAAERALLLPLGSVLGRYGAEEQLRAVEVCRLAMERARDRAQDRLREQGRVAVGVSAAGAAVLAVLLL